MDNKKLYIELTKKRDGLKVMIDVNDIDVIEELDTETKEITNSKGAVIDNKLKKCSPYSIIFLPNIQTPVKETYAEVKEIIKEAHKVFSMVTR